MQKGKTMTPDLPTREQIEASRKICEAATTEPWIHVYDKACIGLPSSEYTICKMDGDHLVGDDDEYDDLKFIAHARTELPVRNAQCLALLDEIEHRGRLLMEYAKHTNGCLSDPSPRCVCGYDDKVAPICEELDIQDAAKGTP